MEAIELDGFPFNKRVFRLPIQHLHRNLAVILRVPRCHHESVLIQIDFVDKIFQNEISHLWIVEVCMEEPVEVRFYRVLVLEKRLPDHLGFYGVVQDVFSFLKLGHAPLRSLVEYSCLYCLDEVGKPFLNVPALLLKAGEILGALVIILIILCCVNSDGCKVWLFGVLGGWHGLGRTVPRTPSGFLGYHPVAVP